MPQEAQFDVQGARSAGYSDDEILQHLGKSRGYDVDGALKAGYSTQEVIEHLSKSGGTTQAGAAKLRPTTANNEVENARPSTLSRVASEAAALPARVAGVQVEKDAGTNWLKNMVRMAGQVVNPARVGPPGFLKDIVNQMNDTSREGVTIAKTGQSVEPAAANETGAFQTRPGGPVRKLSGELEHPLAAGMVRAAASMVPVVGPAAVSVGHNMATGAQDPVSNAFDAATVAGQAVTMANPELAEKATNPVVKPTAALVKRAGTAIAETGSNVLSRLRVPEAQKAMTQAIQPGVNVPKAQESIGIAGPRMQQIRQAKGIEIPEKGPEALKVALDLNREAKAQVLSAIEDRMGPVAELRPDAKSVADAIRKSVDDITLERTPGAKEAVEKAAQTYERQGADAWSIRQMENRMHTLNNHLGRIYSQPTTGEGSIPIHAEISLAEAAELRKVIDQSVERLSGEGVKDLKREYGAQRDVEKGLARQYAIASRVKGAPLWEGLAYLQAAGDLATGGVWGAAKAAAELAVGKRMQLLRDPGHLVNRSFHGSKAFEAAEPIAPHAGPPAPAGLLPAPATEAGWTQADASGPVRGGRYTTPAAHLTDEKPQVAKFLRVINKNQPKSPMGLLRESNTEPTSTPPPVNQRFARESVAPVQGREWTDERRMGPFGEGGIRTTPKAALRGTSTEEAHLLVRQTLDVLRSGDRPGRYFNEDAPWESTTANGRNAAKGERMGGHWQGVKSARTMLPWINETDFSPAELERALSVFEKTGKMNSVMRSAAEFVERESKKGTASREPGEEREPGDEVPF